ncbi:pyridoxamine 5'-phosphate oxidase family protein [Leeia oryzae]|uniref:pyridoxamine 5'-phosphate oxidase family protein n=1 Tax=Leeia oryzae TaxID=356662 RepID=UPI0003680D12|nr:pyridoxamine 5'-phosphate oxidase family protein [Leeia oryzae]
MVQAFFDDLNETLAHAWRLLELGVKDPRVGSHLPVLATVGLDGTPQARTVVLRGVDVKTRQVFFFSDCRTQKMAELAKQPVAVLQMYDHAQKIQLQLRGEISVHHGDEVAERFWQTTRMHSRRAYLVNPAPGQTIGLPGNGLPKDLSYRAPSLAESEAGKPYFVVLSLHVSELTWLYLAPFNQRRALYQWSHGQLDACWQVP